MIFITSLPGSSSQLPSRLGLLPGTFNPPTLAHIALAESALSRVDAVLLVLPGCLPHKNWEGASKQERIEMLRMVTGPLKRIGAAVSSGGLFIEIAREAREYFPDAEIHLICGRDAAERIVGWNYAEQGGEEGAIERMLREFRLLVAPRNGVYQPPAHLSHAIESLDAGCWDDVSSTLVRHGDISQVPDQIKKMVERIYR